MLEVISSVTDSQREKIKTFLEEKEVKTHRMESESIFDLQVTVFHGASNASVRIRNYHTNIVSITKDDKVVHKQEDCSELAPAGLTDHSLLNVKDILEFAESVEIPDVKDLIEQQIDYNMKIAEEGLKAIGAQTWVRFCSTSGAMTSRSWPKPRPPRARMRA